MNILTATLLIVHLVPEQGDSLFDPFDDAQTAPLGVWFKSSLWINPERQTGDAKLGLLTIKDGIKNQTQLLSVGSRRVDFRLSDFFDKQQGISRRGNITSLGTTSLFFEFENVSSAKLDETTLRGNRTDKNDIVTGQLASGTETDDVDYTSKTIWLRGSYGILGSKLDSFTAETFILLGFSEFSLDGDVFEPGKTGEQLSVDGAGEPGYGLGLRAKLCAIQNFSIFSEISFKRFTPEIDKLDRVDSLDLLVPSGSTSKQDFRAEINLLNFSLYTTTNVDLHNITLWPYAGLQFTSFKFEIDGHQKFFQTTYDGKQTLLYRAKDEQQFGIVLGMELAFLKGSGTFIELRLLNEKSITLGAAVSF